MKTLLISIFIHALLIFVGTFGVKTRVAPSHLIEVALTPAGSVIKKPVVSHVSKQPSSTTKPAAVSAHPQINPGGTAAVPLEIASSASEANSAPIHWYMPLPAYPELGRRFRLQGIAWIKITSNHIGSVIHSTLHQSSGYEVLDQSALAATKNWRVQPNISAIQPVEFRLK